MNKTVLTAVIASLVVLSGCATHQQAGTGVGAVTGAAVGHVIGGGGVVGTVLGGVVGAIAGSAVGESMDQTNRLSSHPPAIVYGPPPPVMSYYPRQPRRVYCHYRTEWDSYHRIYIERRICQ